MELREPSAVNLPLMLVQSAAAGNLVLVKKILKETKMAINTSDPEGRTALHEAIAHGMRVCCREVDGVAHTHKDRETDKTDRHTHTLTLTHTHTHTHTHSLSLSLSLCGLAGHEAVARFLVARGAGCLVKDRQGATPCSEAVRCNMLHVLPPDVVSAHVHDSCTPADDPATGRSPEKSPLPFFQ